MLKSSFATMNSSAPCEAFATGIETLEQKRAHRNDELLRPNGVYSNPPLLYQSGKSIKTGYHPKKPPPGKTFSLHCDLTERLINSGVCSQVEDCHGPLWFNTKSGTLTTEKCMIANEMNAQLEAFQALW